LVPNTPGDPPAADEFVPDTAGVVVVLVNVPVAASAAVGIRAITAAIAPNFQNLFHPRLMRTLPVFDGPHLRNASRFPHDRSTARSCDR
jgi:hypothetical protein